MPDSTRIGPSRLRQAASLIARVAAVSLLLLMFWLTHYPVEVRPGFTMHDKVFHLVAYMTLTFLLLLNWELSSGVLQPRHYIVLFLLCTLYGAFDEVTQIPVGRICDVFDWLADVVGTLLGLAFYRLLRPLASRFT